MEGLHLWRLSQSSSPRKCGFHLGFSLGFLQHPSTVGGQQSRTVSTATAQKDRWLIPLISATGELARVYPATMTLLDHRPCLNGRRIRSAGPGQTHPAAMAGNSPCLQPYSCNGSYVMRADSSALTLRLVWQSLGETLPAHIRRTYNGTAEPSAGLRRECKLPIWRELHLGGPQSLIQFVSFTH